MERDENGTRCNETGKQEMLEICESSNLVSDVFTSRTREEKRSMDGLGFAFGIGEVRWRVI